jgi:hypothetical protein
MHRERKRSTKSPPGSTFTPTTKSKGNDASRDGIEREGWMRQKHASRMAGLSAMEADRRMARQQAQPAGLMRARHRRQLDARL